MSTETPPSAGGLLGPFRPSSRRSSRSSELPRRPGTSSGFLSPLGKWRSSSEDSRSARSGSSAYRTWFRRVVAISNRSRSSSSVSIATLQNQAPGKPDFEKVESWIDGFRKYNQLITNEVSGDRNFLEDILSDIQDTLEEGLHFECPGGFVHDLPEALFDLALLWCPSKEMPEDQFARREGSDRPSWSWTGWKCPVNFPFDPTNCPDISAKNPNPMYFKSEVKEFHIVPPKSDPYLIRRDLKHPRIGYPSSHVIPKGVKPPKEGKRTFTILPNYNSKTAEHAEQTKQIFGNFDTLRFSAQTISVDGFTLTQMSYEDDTIPCCEMKDVQGRKCGVLMDYYNEVHRFAEKRQDFLFVLLSRNRRCEATVRDPVANTVHPPGTPIWHNNKFLHDDEIADFDPEHFLEGEWSMLNFMLVQKMNLDHEDEYYERVAIGRIHEDAWKQRNPVLKKDIILK